VKRRAFLGSAIAISTVVALEGPRLIGHGNGQYNVVAYGIALQFGPTIMTYSNIHELLADADDELRSRLAHTIWSHYGKPVPLSMERYWTKPSRNHTNCCLPTYGIKVKAEIPWPQQTREAAHDYKDQLTMWEESMDRRHIADAIT
jgi:hypothetical protein